MNTVAKPDFTIRPQKATSKPGVEQIADFWNPNNPSIRFADEGFMRKVRTMTEDDDIRITWNPIIEKWQVFARAPRLQHPICHGWKLLFIHHDGQKGYLPLDERLLARLASCSAKFQGNGVQYIDRIIAQMQRDEAAAEKQWSTDSQDAAMPSFDHAQIQVSMRGHSNGSKFSTYHAGI